MGMSFELLFKAFYVAKDKAPPTQNGHCLLKLCNESGVTFSEKEKNLLDILSGYIIWQGRYPTPNDKRNYPGYSSIKHQWGAYRASSRPDYSPFDNNVVHLDDIERKDFDFDKLQKIWTKVNSKYIESYIEK